MISVFVIRFFTRRILKTLSFVETGLLCGPLASDRVKASSMTLTISSLSASLAGLADSESAFFFRSSLLFLGTTVFFVFFARGQFVEPGAGATGGGALTIIALKLSVVSGRAIGTRLEVGGLNMVASSPKSHASRASETGSKSVWFGLTTSIETSEESLFVFCLLGSPSPSFCCAWSLLSFSLF